MIEVKDLVKEYKIENKAFRAVDQVSFSVEKGEIYGIIGLSGAGKSTLVRMINRLEEPSSGRIYIEGTELTSLSKTELLKRRKEIGMIFQSFNLFHQKTVFENIAYPLRIGGLKESEISERVKELLKFIDLEDKEKAYPAELSGGQKQRVAIARAIANRPKVLLSDEGTSALDPSNTKQVLELLKKIVKEYQMTIILITHQMEVAKDICDRIAVMENGKIVEENTVEELFKNPKHPVTISFIESLQEPTEEKINKEDFKGTLVRITYGDQEATKPVISHLIREFDLDINIIQGSLNNINKKSVGYLIVEFIGDKENIYAALDQLEQYNVRGEVL